MHPSVGWPEDVLTRGARGTVSAEALYRQGGAGLGRTVFTALLENKEKQSLEKTASASAHPGIFCSHSLHDSWKSL